MHNSGVIETTGASSSKSDIGTVKIGSDVVGGAGTDSGRDFQQRSYRKRHAGHGWHGPEPWLCSQVT